MTLGSILVTGPDGLEQEIPLGGTQLWIGSAPNNDLVIDRPSIAPHHAMLSCDPHGRLLVAIDSEHVAEQGGMHLTFNLAQVAQPRELARLGDYVLSYQPATWDRQTQPLRLADLPADAHDGAPAPHHSADETALLQTLLSQDLAQQPMYQSHEAVTLAMPLIALAACGEPPLH
ncbi:MAG: FHA domain-containing protein [Roseiflexaceae bacterium]